MPDITNNIYKQLLATDLTIIISHSELLWKCGNTWLRRATPRTPSTNQNYSPINKTASALVDLETVTSSILKPCMKWPQSLISILYSVITIFTNTPLSTDQQLKPRSPRLFSFNFLYTLSFYILPFLFFNLFLFPRSSLIFFLSLFPLFIFFLSLFFLKDLFEMLFWPLSCSFRKWESSAQIWLLLLCVERKVTPFKQIRV